MTCRLYSEVEMSIPDGFRGLKAGDLPQRKWRGELQPVASTASGEKSRTQSVDDDEDGCAPPVRCNSMLIPVTDVGLSILDRSRVVQGN